MKSLSKRGLRKKKKQANIISEEQEKQLLDKGIFGEDTPQELLDTALFQLGVAKEHRSLKCGELRPKDGKCDALYLCPQKYITESCWFADSPVGVYQIQQTVSRLCKTDGFSGIFFTNHSPRSTVATMLYNAGVDLQLVVEKTGHMSSAVRNHKRTNGIQLANVSAALQGEKC
ncbi:uncharacterized protein LOC117317412 [Pecten maximus]|uniref:uncharacterized protein LOC117317412 n=1 Tax=Pecten maximus TaxID=6579 RepID=UPI0014591879|nr:uncharacterized protein LOC117317412 [Pecten maximus]